MGCQSSKLDHADDSIHVILSHANKKGDIKSGHSNYVPRQPHPLLNRAEPPTATEESEADEESQNDIDRLLFHAAHHNDTIDSRDLEDYGTDDGEEKHVEEQVRRQ